MLCIGVDKGVETRPWEKGAIVRHGAAIRYFMPLEKRAAVTSQVLGGDGAGGRHQRDRLPPRLHGRAGPRLPPGEPAFPGLSSNLWLSGPSVAM